MTHSQKPSALPPEDERFRLIARATNDIFWNWDLQTNAAWRSEGASETFGYPTEQQFSNVNFWINRIHPEDRERMQNSLKAASSGSLHQFRCRKDTDTIEGMQRFVKSLVGFYAIMEGIFFYSVFGCYFSSILNGS